MGKIYYRYYIVRAKYQRLRRLSFPSPAEVRFIEIHGGECKKVEWLKDPRTHFPLVWHTSMGKILKREYIQREVRVGSKFVDFGTQTPYYKKAIEIDGYWNHRDILKEMERDKYLASRGWQVLHVSAGSVFRSAMRTQQRTLEFLAR
jgi:very-short-patch-repair endonuclease